MSGCTYIEDVGTGTAANAATPWGIQLNGSGHGGQYASAGFYGGGGGGGYAKGVFAVTPGASLTITVGTGGTAGSGGGYCSGMQNGLNGRIIIWY